MNSLVEARAELLAERQQTQARLAGLERDFASSVAAAEAANSDDEHDPEGATLAFERQHVAALIDAARDRLGQIEAAVARIDAGTYGLCSGCGAPIGTERLAARPAASTCIGCAGRASRGRRS
jgi:RNA polymerase-binding transcription factor